MTDYAEVGDRVLVRGTITGRSLIPDEGSWALVEFAGNPEIRVFWQDIDSIVEPAPPTFSLGDKVTDGMGTKFEVIMAPRETENGRMIVGLWSDVNGVDWQYPDRLKRLTE